MLRKFIPILLVASIYQQILMAQKIASGWKSNQIFQSHFFVENNGQFDAKASKDKPILFGVDNNADFVYFNKHGFLWELRKWVEDPNDIFYEQKRGEKLNAPDEKDDEKKYKMLEEKLNMEWINANPNTSLIASERSGHYFTFGKAELNSYGYKKILYKNLYDGIDAEYIIPDKGGIKYSLIVSPDADLSKVRFNYTGKGVSMLMGYNKIVIKNKLEHLVESELNVFDEEGNKIGCQYKAYKDGIGFELSGNYKAHGKIIIDPWVTTITTLTGGLGNNIGYDVDYDYTGNLFVYGGGSSGNIKVAKYSVTGALLWTFNGNVVSPAWNSVGVGSYAGNFIVEKLSGKVYLGQGFNSGPGSTMVRINGSGVYDNFISAANPNFNEIWEMNFDCNTGNILGMGGGTSGNINMGIINSLGSYSTSNITGIGGICQDIVSSTIDPSGNLFVAMTTSCGDPFLYNKIIRVNGSLNGNLWIQPIGYSNLFESNNKPFVTSSFSNGLNCLHANVNYLYYYDGLNIKAFDKNTGLSVGAPIAIPSYTVKQQAGIYVDDCDNLYLGGNNGNILVYHFDGSIFTVLPEILLPGLSGKKVHDIKYNQGNSLLYITGNNFVATANRSNFCPDTATLNINLSINCDSVIATIINADSSSLYTFIWTDSTSGAIVQSTNNTANTADTLHTLVSGHHYNILVLKNALCGGASQFLSFVGANSNSISNNASICAGQSLVVNGHTYTMSGTYVDTIVSITGCDSIITTNLSVSPYIQTNQNVAICNGQSISINGHTYSLTGSYLDTLTSLVSCDTILTTQLVVDPPITQLQSITVCYGQSISVNGHVYSLSGNYIDTIISLVNCDTILTTQLVVNPPITQSQNVSICNGQSLTINGHIYSTAGIYIDTLAGVANCDTILTTNLSLTPLINQSQNVTICYGQSLQINGHVYTNSGNYIDTLASITGCDTVLLTQLNVLPPIVMNQLLTICEGEHIVVNGHSYSNPGNYQDTLLTTSGCDSIIFTQLNVNDTSVYTQTYSLCTGQGVIVNGHTYNVGGIYHDTMLNSNGCDSVIHTQLAIIPTVTNQQTITICTGQSYSINGHTYSSSGIYHDTTTASSGCDSIIITTLVVDAYINIVQQFTICKGEKITVNGHEYSSSGLYIDTMNGVLNCDTILQTTLNVNENSTFNQTIAICEGDDYTINGHTYNLAGTYYDSLNNSLGCDSIIITKLKVLKTSGSSNNTVICKGKSITVNQHVYNSSGIYKDTFKNALGCDSILTTFLTVDQSSYGDNFIANVFTPNGDNLNDCFGVSYWKNIKEIEFMIYNRWGEAVFTTKELWDCWNGNYKGEKSEQGTYFYYIKAKSACGESIYKGDVILIR